MTIKLGQINFPGADNGNFALNDLINDLNKISIIKYEIGYPLIEQCNIVFYPTYGDLELINKIKGKPLLIFWTYEHLCKNSDNDEYDPYKFYKRNNLSIGFYDDCDDNLFFPYFVLYLKSMIYVLENNKKTKNKTKFCTFCASNKNIYHAQFRTDFVEYVSNKYKEITCCGKVLNNTNNELLPQNHLEASIYHNPYKFNLCFENHESSGNFSYITEKIVMAYIYNVIPIYWGSDRITEWFNPLSFINCNGLSYEQMLNEIKNIDNDDNKYQYMLFQKPMREDPYDVYIYFIKKLDKFIQEHYKY